MPENGNINAHKYKMLLLVLRNKAILNCTHDCTVYFSIFWLAWSLIFTYITFGNSDFVPGFSLSAFMTTVVATHIQPDGRVPSLVQSTYSHKTKCQREQQRLYGASSSRGTCSWRHDEVLREEQEVEGQEGRDMISVTSCYIQSFTTTSALSLNAQELKPNWCVLFSGTFSVSGLPKNLRPSPILAFKVTILHFSSILALIQ